MFLNPIHVQDEPLELRDTLPPEVLELNEPLARAFAPVEVSLVAIRDGKNIIVTGRLSTTLQLLCGRCADWMDWPVKVDDVIWDFEDPTEPTLNLTPFIREDILLNLPLNAVCQLDDKFRCPHSGKKFVPKESGEKPIHGRDTWKALDQLKKKLKD
jgi:uncharacterized protein